MLHRQAAGADIQLFMKLILRNRSRSSGLDDASLNNRNPTFRDNIFKGRNFRDFSKIFLPLKMRTLG
jgi:hypothetical protein